MNNCQNCGTEFQGSFCPNCKTSSNSRQTQPNNSTINVNINCRDIRTSVKSKWVAFFLCLFFGLLGIHRFYVGKVGTGILYFFTAGLFSIGWLVDLISIACGSFRDSYGDFLKR